MMSPNRTSVATRGHPERIAAHDMATADVTRGALGGGRGSGAGLRGWPVLAGREQLRQRGAGLGGVGLRLWIRFPVIALPGHRFHLVIGIVHELAHPRLLGLGVALADHNLV